MASFTFQSTLRAIFLATILVAVMVGAFLLPKFIQNTGQFQPLAESMSAAVAAPEPDALPEPESLAVETTEAPNREPSPESGLAIEPLPTPVAEVAESAPAPAVVVDMAPFLVAFSRNEFEKAAAILELMKADLPEEKFAEYATTLADAEKRAVEEETARQKKEAEWMQSQTLLAETLKELKQSNDDTKKMIAELQSKDPVSVEEPKALESVVPDKDWPAPATIQFSFDSAKVSDEGQALLLPLLEGMKTNPTATVEIRGYADKSGSAEYNVSLAKARAHAIRDEFRKVGIPLERIEVVAFGASQAGDEQSDPKALRRVEVELMR